MLRKIYLILTGEDEHKRPRSKKLLELIRVNNLNNNEYKIVVSGLSGFKLKVDSSESSRLAKYLIERNVLKENIILEEESMDTLGNMIFSHRIIEQLLRQNTINPIEIVLITEGFHMHRSKKLFLKIFQDLKNLNNQISFSFESGNTFGISSFYWKRKLDVIVEKLKRHIKVGGDLKEYLKKWFIVDKRYMLDFMILDMILTDFDIFRLKTYEDYTNFLFSLPIYSEKYKPSHKYLTQYSIYAHAIEHLIAERNKK